MLWPNRVEYVNASYLCLPIRPWPWLTWPRNFRVFLGFSFDMTAMIKRKIWWILRISMINAAWVRKIDVKRVTRVKTTLEERNIEIIRHPLTPKTIWRFSYYNELLLNTPGRRKAGGVRHKTYRPLFPLTRVTARDRLDFNTGPQWAWISKFRKWGGARVGLASYVKKRTKS